MSDENKKPGTILPSDPYTSPHPNQIGPWAGAQVGSMLEAESYLKSPYYHDSYYFPFNPDPLARGNNYKIYDEMKDDDQVKVALSFKKGICINSGWQIRCDRPEVKHFVETDLKRMQESGSLQMSFEDCLWGMFGAYEYGFSIAEPVFKVKDGYYGFESIRVRPPQSFRFQVQDKGDVTEIIQMTNRGEMFFDPKLFIHHVYQPEYGNPYGRSDLSAVYAPWKAKKFCTKFLAIYLERYAGPMPVGRYPSNWGPDEVAQLAATLKNIQQTTSLAIPEDAMIEFVEANKNSSDLYIKALDYYNMHIARGLLVPDLLGISGDKTGGGSYNLGEQQFRMFLSSLEKDRRSLARKITLRLINPLVAANFGPGIVCDFEFMDYSIDNQPELLKLWADVVKAGVFKPNADEVNYLRRQLKFPEGPVDLTMLKPKIEPGAVPEVPQTPEPKANEQTFTRQTVRKTKFAGLPINVEIDKGQTKSGKDANGIAWSHLYAFPYGEIDGTEGEDLDPVDVYLGPDEGAPQVFVVHQVDEQGKFDEDKVFLGFRGIEDAEKAYRDHGPAWGFGSIDSMTLGEFIHGYLAANRKFRQEMLPGGLSEGHKETDYDPAALAKGIKVEMEHTTDEEVAKEIAMDHLTEDPAYYDKLEAAGLSSKAPHIHFALKRKLTSAERKMDFAQIQRTLDIGEKDLAKRMKRGATAIWKDLVKQVKESGFIKRFDPARMGALKPRFLRDMNIEIKHSFRDMLEAAHKEAQRELFPDRKFGLDEGELELEDMMAVLEAEAFNITKDYAGLTSKKVNSLIAQGLKQGLDEGEIVDSIMEAMPSLTETWVDTLVRTKTTEIYNRGRKSYFDNDELAQSVIEAYQFSAIMDARTTEVCANMDKRIFSADDENINLLTPPLHFNCRSIIVPITKYEKDSLDGVEDMPSREELQDMGAGLLSLNAETVKPMEEAQ